MDKLHFFLISMLVIMGMFLNQAVNADTRFETLGFAALDTIEPDDLDGLSGRDSLTNVQSIQELDASVSHSTFNVDTILTGAITIERQALNNFEGVGLFNIFTGNNNAVNSAVGISIYLTE